LHLKNRQLEVTESLGKKEGRKQERRPGIPFILLCPGVVEQSIPSCSDPHIIEPKVYPEHVISLPLTYFIICWLQCSFFAPIPA